MSLPCRICLAAWLLLSAGLSPAAVTPGPAGRPLDAADTEAQGRLLAQKLLAQRPTEDYTATGTLEIRRHPNIPIKFVTRVTASNWTTSYTAVLSTNQLAQLVIVHADGQANEYYYATNQVDTVPVLGDIPILSHLYRSHKLTGAGMSTPFAGSDFWLGDLGLEFFHWPQQKLLRNETKRSQSCSVLESTNPQPTPGGYARVESWIDTESGGIVQAWAYDTNNEVLKEFYPKDIKKVNGQRQVGMMEMDNDTTDSRTRLVFDLDATSPQK